MLGKNTLINGGSFVQNHGVFTTTSVDNQVNNITNNQVGGFERLQMAVASAAFHNSAQRLDPPKCHVNTREVVLRSIMDWITNGANRQTWIFWLNGAAGAGKSAIAQSIAELCEQMGVPLASFFFFRTDSTRNRIKPLVATLAYQLALNVPEAREAISSAIEHDPLVFDRSFESQFISLVMDPLRKLGYFTPNADTPEHPLVFVIDGLDECVDRKVQEMIVRNIAKLLGDTKLPILFLVASRPENHLMMVFNSRTVDRLLTRLALDDTYLPDADILRFLKDKFVEIKETHPLADMIDPRWPAEEDIHKLVAKSSGQFIYASVVIKFLSSPSQHPAQRLEIVQGLQPVGNDTPFAQLDALYRHIFSTVDDLQGALRVLAYSILAGETYTNVIERILHLSEGAVRIALADLTSVLVCQNFVIKYLHASLPDFLLDPLRSQEYYINPAKWHTEFARHWFSEYKLGRVGWIVRLQKHLRNAIPTPELREDILQFQPTSSQINFLLSNSSASSQILELFEFLVAVEDLAFGDDGEVYKHQRRVIISFVKTTFPNHHNVLNENEVVVRIVARQQDDDGISQDVSPPPSSTGLNRSRSASKPQPQKLDAANPSPPLKEPGVNDAKLKSKRKSFMKWIKGK